MTKARDLADLLDASGNIIAQGTIDGRDIASDGSKLDSIEHGATGDQTHSEIRALITAGVDTNVFTDADHSKLDGIEAGATADQTAAEIKTSYESNANTNEFSDAEQSKLAGIETGATADQTKADIDALNVDADTLDGQHGSYYTSYADTAVANIVDSAPGTLDTLNELAAALGDDPNFATTTATNIGTKANKTITVSAGSGLTGGGDLTANRTISHADTSTVSDVNGSGNTFIQDIGFDTYGHVTSVGTGTVTVGDGAMTVTAGSGLSGGGQLGTANQSGASSVTVSHADTSSQASVDNSGRTYIQDITLDTYGHITGIASATETVVNTDTTYSAGSGLNLTGTTFSVTDAPKWTTARTLSLSGDASGSVSWDGSGNATLSVTVADNSHNHDYVPERNRTDWSDGTVIGDVIGQLAWKNYGNNHTIFDASASTSPDGTSVNNTNSTDPWSSTYPTLMGWNGNITYGVRVDSARNADLLDNLDSSQFVRSDTADSKSGNLNLTSGTELLVGGEFSHNAYAQNGSSTIYLGGGNDRANYSIGTELNNYAGNYTKLDLRWHTGIRFFTLPNYGGVRFFNDAAMNNKIFSIGETDGNVRVTNTIYANQFHGDGSNLTGIDAGAPAGSIIYHAGSSAPSGYIKANGASLSTSTYSALFSAIGYTYGGSGGSFNVPDLRGEFIRGWDDGRGVDSGRSFGSFQSDDFGSHSHTAYGGFSSSWFAVYARSGNWGNERFITSNSYSTTSTGAADTRPRNRAMLACIKT